jgi:serine protease Do
MVRQSVVALFFSVAISCPTAGLGQSVLEQMERDVAAVVRQARGGVVAIEDERIALGKEDSAQAVPAGKSSEALKGLKGFPRPDPAKAAVNPTRSAPKSGTGFCIADSYVVTTADVLEGMRNPVVATDSGARYRATVVKIDPELNIGLLRLPEKNGIAELPLGESSSILAGHFAITVGNQGGHINSVSLATVASIRSEGTFSGSRFYPRLIQIAGTVGSGSSGSPLLNSRGQVIGMLAAAPAAETVGPAAADKSGKSVEKPAHPTRATVTSAGFAIPIDDLKPVIAEMRTAKFYARAWIGVDLREEGRTEQDSLTIRVRRTLWIEGVYPESPAAKAGLQKGDVIVTMNDREIRTLGDFRAVVVGLRQGSRLRVEALRGGKRLSVDVLFEMRPPLPGAATNGKS